MTDETYKTWRMAVAGAVIGINNAQRNAIARAGFIKTKAGIKTSVRHETAIYFNALEHCKCPICKTISIKGTLTMTEPAFGPGSNPKIDEAAAIRHGQQIKTPTEWPEALVERVALAIARIHSDATGCCFPGDTCKAQSDGLPCYCLKGSTVEALAALDASGLREAQDQADIWHKEADRLAGLLLTATEALEGFHLKSAAIVGAEAGHLILRVPIEVIATRRRALARIKGEQT